MNDRQIQQLERTIGSAYLRVGSEVDLTYGTDASSEAQVMPDVLCLPEDPEQLDELLVFAEVERIPITPRGAGSGKVGGCIPTQRGIVISLEQLNQVTEIDEANRMIACQAGVTTGDLQAHAEAAGLFYPPDPASLEYCTIGGNVATNAGGPRAYKYGVTRHYVQQLRVHCIGGEVVHLGGKSLKRQNGLDLLQLLVGSEGTLGVVSEITLRLIPLPQMPPKTYLLFTQSLDLACKLVASIGTMGWQPCAAELIDTDILNLSRGGLVLPVTIPKNTSALLLEYDNIEQPNKLTDRLNNHIANLDATVLDVSAVDLRGSVWSWRRKISTMLKTAFAFKTSEDIVVPPEQMPKIVSFTKSLGHRHGLTIMCYGHAGDGNIHVNMLANQIPSYATLDAFRLQLFTEVIRCGGHLSGEHGIGSQKRKFMSLDHSAGVMRLMLAVKRAWDPLNLLNPGKIWPTV